MLLKYLNFLPWQFGNPKKPNLHSVHLVPTTFGTQVHSPLLLHDIEEDPEVLHPHAEKSFKYII